MSDDPHKQAVVHRAGDPSASQALIIIHGRWAGAATILPLGERLSAGPVAMFAPEAVGNSWWPTSFLAPMNQLEPSLTSALECIDRVYQAVRADGFADHQISLAGFSQGGCLALEYTARYGRSLRAVSGFSAGLVGTSDAETAPEAALYDHRDKLFDYASDLSGLPIYMSCHCEDPHIPEARVKHSADVLKSLGADVTLNLHPGAHHMVMPVDVEIAGPMLCGLDRPV